jgi:nitrogenase molybdenum-iron protein alpha/beta subunit/MoaA/NifB/PqqE/SkfB family radical SAM enzyme
MGIYRVIGIQVMRMKTNIKPLRNLNINPCKMCMPLGAVTALYGIQGCMSILHGSQGCSTYIRRHMATHYNEPVDMASSSLTENGTVYGGEENLIKGIKNLIDIYQPSVVGVPTTCLAETIGEDIPRMIEKFREEHPEYKKVVIIPVHSPGYSGTQYEGYFRALYHIVSQVQMNKTPNNKINVITSYLSPADTRFLKEMFRCFGLDVILLPDLSDNLDGGYKESYSKLPKGGTPLEEIRKMAGAIITLELCNMDMEESPGKYLEQEYGVPYKRLNLPTGIRDTDAFYYELCRLSGLEMPEEIKEQRYRYLDSMVDSHKYNSEGRAVIYGEPDQIISIVRLCQENGIVPVAVATGSKCPKLVSLVEPEVSKVAGNYFVSEYEIKDDADFKDIEYMAIKYKANVLIGNSDGRRIENKLGIPLVRRGFPIHDRVGGQRLRLLGYEGTLTLLDEITNAVLSQKETGFRDEVYQKYYKDTSIDETILNKSKTDLVTIENVMEQCMEKMKEKTQMHPCYHCGTHKYARIHLPVAPRCNVQCNYCIRKFDCPNESRPGVTTSILTPKEAFLRYKKAKEKMSNLTVAGIAGPGDALANWEETKRTFELIREYDKKVTFCLSTNGLMLPIYAKELVKLGVTHVTVTINAVDPHIAGCIYQFISYKGKRYEKDAAGAIMISNQLNGLRILISYGVICKVNIVVLKGINDVHIPEIVQTVKDIGCFMTNIMPHLSVEGSPFAHLPKLNEKEIEKLRNECSSILKQMYHCKQCRADAVGTLENDKSIEFGLMEKEEQSTKEETYRFAVASKNGSLVDLHFGHVEEFYIYECKNGEANFLETRKVKKYCNVSPDCDQETDKIEPIIRTISDCHGVLAMRMGEIPKKKLRERGIKVITTYDKVVAAVIKAAKSYSI